MYERAGPAPVWHLDGPRTFFAGPLRYNASHQHGAPVYLAGLYGSFRLRVRGGAWLACRTAMIPAGVPHELDLDGDPLGVLYLEPDAAGSDALGALLRGAREEHGALVGAGGETLLLRDLYESRGPAGEAGPALADLLLFSGREARAVDDRVARAVTILRAREEPLAAATLGAAVGLSASRLQHLFTRDVGVPYRRYRAWDRMRRAIGAITAGASFTAAAHEAGFSDQPHFAHDFRKTFGAPASLSLSRIRR